MSEMSIQMKKDIDVDAHKISLKILDLLEKTGWTSPEGSKAKDALLSECKKQIAEISGNIESDIEDLAARYSIAKTNANFQDLHVMLRRLDEILAKLTEAGI